jgi:hypothetical protein
MVAATEPPGVSAWEDPWRSLGGGPSASSSASAGSSSSAGDGAWADGSDGTAPRGDSFAHATERASFKAQERALGTAWHAADVGYEAAYNAERQLADLAGTTNIEVRSETEIRDAIDHDVKIVLYNSAYRRSPRCWPLFFVYLIISCLPCSACRCRSGALPYCRHPPAANATNLQRDERDYFG